MFIGACADLIYQVVAGTYLEAVFSGLVAGYILIETIRAFLLDAEFTVGPD